MLVELFHWLFWASLEIIESVTKPPSENDLPFETNSTAARTSLKSIVLIAFNDPFCDSCCFWMVKSCLVYCTALFICMNLEGQHLWAPIKIVYLIIQCASTLVTVWIGFNSAGGLACCFCILLAGSDAGLWKSQPLWHPAKEHCSTGT